MTTEAAGLTVERREELRREAVSSIEWRESMRYRADDARVILALLDALAAAEAERDEARAAVERVRALADEFARDEGRMWVATASDDIRAALDTATSEGA